MNLLFKILLLAMLVVLGVFILERTGMMDTSFTETVLPVTADSGDDDDDVTAPDEDEGEEDRIRIIDGYKAITVDDEVIEAAGLEFGQPSPMSFQPEFNAYAEVMDIAPLVKARSEYSNMQSDIRVLESDLHNQNLILKRAEALHKSRSLSTRELEKHRAERDRTAAELASLGKHLDNLAFEIRSTWGDSIADMVLDKSRQDEFNKLANHDMALVQVSITKERTLTSTEQHVYVSNHNDRGTALAVDYLDKANRVPNRLYGESHIYLLDSPRFRPGARLFAWIEEQGEPLSGLYIPASAVIWYANEPWMYIRSKENQFVRKPLQNARELDQGWIVLDGLSTSDTVVIHGGQTLLSEEFKWAIPDEDDD